MFPGCQRLIVTLFVCIQAAKEIIPHRNEQEDAQQDQERRHINRHCILDRAPGLYQTKLTGETKSAKGRTNQSQNSEG